MVKAEISGEQSSAGRGRETNSRFDYDGLKLPNAIMGVGKSHRWRRLRPRIFDNPFNL
ncbi:hypothetical protein OAF98_02200 [Planctomicrobium sp.]|mgnify:FL=1|nr:hypothetical protein [Planctomicrobium sp.]MDB4733190.1 hypothetical protein [Planctomicrobium sp.]MDB4743273.1 hypothetical protein [Planctomicrobium sp.]